QLIRRCSLSRFAQMPTAAAGAFLPLNTRTSPGLISAITILRRYTTPYAYVGILRHHPNPLAGPRPRAILEGQRTSSEPLGGQPIKYRTAGDPFKLSFGLSGAVLTKYTPLHALGTESFSPIRANPLRDVRLLSSCPVVRFR